MIWESKSEDSGSRNQISSQILTQIPQNEDKVGLSVTVTVGIGVFRYPMPFVYKQRTHSAYGIEIRKPRRFRDSFDRLGDLTSSKQPRRLEPDQESFESEPPDEVAAEKGLEPKLDDEARVGGK